MTCPNCGAAMTTERFEDRLKLPIDIDFCVPCQMFWFDGKESLRLSPGSVLKLFHIIGERGVSPGPGPAGHPSCPRCGIRLLATHDQQRNTRFEYLRCGKEHGRLETFLNFLREKDFIKPLSPSQIDELRKNVKTINCSNCGAPIDLATTTTCAHCGSPLSMLDVNQAGALITELQTADQASRTIDPAFPIRLALARAQAETACAGFDTHPRWFNDVSEDGLVAAGLRSMVRWLNQQT